MRGWAPGPGTEVQSQRVGWWAGEAAFLTPVPHSVLMQPVLGPGVEEPPARRLPDVKGARGQAVHRVSLTKDLG